MHVVKTRELDKDTPSFLEHLNPPQREAVFHTEGPLLILAGAGTGKTRVLTTRLAYILQQQLCSPGHVLAVTFTNKAAQEMRERIQQCLGHSVEGMWLGTFHALSVRILRQHAEKIGFQPTFSIIDADDQQRLLKQILKAENIDEKQLSARTLAIIINRYKDKAKTPDKVENVNDTAARLYRQYQDRLKTLNAMDFGDLLLHCLALFQQCPNVLFHYQNQFRYILVDEYQDTNVTQYLWLRLLADYHKNLCCVGDDDQSIYGWRGAEITNILKFEKDFPNARVIRLEQNYRSTAHILGAASGLIAHNEGRLGKTLWTDQDGGEEILVRGVWNNEEEARFVIEEVEDLERKGENLNTMAILVRAGYQTRDFEERCLKTGVPYRVIGGLRFYERQEIRDALAYLKLLVQPDDGLALERIINVPKRGVGSTTIQHIHARAREMNVSFPKAALHYAINDSKGMMKAQLQQFFDNLDRWRKLLDNTPHAEVAKIVLDESGYTGMWLEEKSPDAPGRLENLKELVNAIEEFEFLPGFLDHVSLVADNNAKNSDDALSIMTLHAAKGLEFNYVFLPGWEENLFPHPRSLQDNGREGLEEERRLGYVGISRAKKRAIISYALQRRLPQGWQMGLPSRFLKELPNEHILHIQANGQESAIVDKYNTQTREVSFDDYDARHFDIGDQVFHQKFGYGEIIDYNGDKALVEFDYTNTKHIHISYLRKV